MITTNLAKSILSKALFTQSTRAVYSQAGFEKQVFKEKRKQRELKAYQKLFHSSPIMNINIQMIMAINQLRPKATYIIAAKNGQFPKQILNNTYNIIECLNYIQGFKYFYKSFPALVQNMTRVLSEKLDFQTTGLHKVNAIKKLVLMLSSIDSIYGEILNELVCVYMIWGMQSSIKIKRKLIDTLAPLKKRIAQINEKKKSLLENVNHDESNLSKQNKQSLEKLNEEISIIENEMKKAVFQNKFMKQEDFLCGLNYCLQRGYYSETIIRQFTQNILQCDNYSVPDFEYYLKDEQQYVNQKPISDIFNKRALIYSRMYNGIIYRIKILNELKRMKKSDTKFMDFLKQQKSVEQDKQSESSSQESPFINGANGGIEETSQSSSEQKAGQMSDKLIEQSLISQKAYTGLVTKYLELLERKDVLCYILSEQATSESFRILETQFFSYMHEPNHSLTITNIKSRYLNIFKEIFNIEKNGTIYIDSPNVEVAFEVILKMCDYGDRKEIFDLLKLYERHLITKKVSQLKCLAPFYVFQKYNYKSNFVASKFFEYINFKYRLGREESTIKEELILTGNEICRYLSLYFKLLESDFSNQIPEKLPKIFGGNTEQKILSSESQSQVRQSKVKYYQQFQQAVEIFLNNYNKIISVIYLERENSGFIGKGIELSSEFLRMKYLSTKSYEQNLYIQGKLPEEDIRKIINQSSQVIRQHREYVKNVYEKEFQTKISTKLPTGVQLTTKALNYNPFTHAMWLKKSSVFNPLDQIIAILDIVETAIKLQTMKNMQFYEDVLVVFKSIFENKKLIKLLNQHPIFPELLKKLIKISQLFKGSYKNESNKLFESILTLTNFNLNSFLHSARINIAKQIINADKTVPIDERFQPYMQNLQMNLKLQKNIRIWEQGTYQINKQTVINHIRSDIINSALSQNAQLKKIIRDQLAKIKTIKPNQKIKNIKFQLNYLEYPYLANVAINKNNELIVILVRRAGNDSDKEYNAVLNSYYDECENYFRKKGNKVIVATNQTEIRNSLREITQK